ncbi:hypothetical protein MUN88_12370 [Gracilibacillus caseinilyticus]|uniref:DUF1304 domain-containing protein n=1 Tax=Gracilibacillus caseinilyticus TaxID=2932256 RepID=A0ABY4ESP1_9BACI|nr:hypothetical protein [Gracilibacillus caseinilyticus]UOQ46887.1 hypothetical protein MUN88_12370 [Gracilibacillus caseinilyticus]
METFNIQLAALILVVIFVAIAIFQMLLILGYPVGEYAMGGENKVLPGKFRLVSIVNAALLLGMATVVLHHTSFLTTFDMPTLILMWIITSFLAINTIANLVSPGKKEKLVMTPVAGLAFLLSFLITII